MRGPPGGCPQGVSLRMDKIWQVDWGTIVGGEWPVRVEPRAHFQFIARQFALVEALCRRDRPMREAEVLELIAIYGEGNTTPEDLIYKGILKFYPQTQEYQILYSLGEYVREKIKARRLISGEWTNQQLQTLEFLLLSMEQRLTSGTEARSDGWYSFNQRLFELEKQVESIRSAVEGNLDAIREQVGAYRKQIPGAIRDRFAWISRLWDDYIVPMRGMFSPTGDWERLVKAFEQVLRRVEELNAPAEIRDRSRLLSQDLGGMIRAAQHADREGSREVWPIYDSVKTDGTIARDAAHLLEAARKLPKGSIQLKLDTYFGVADPWGGERLIKPFDDQDLSRKLAILLDRQPSEPPTLTDVGAVPLPSIITPDDLLVRMEADGQAPGDTLKWLAESFPEVPLSEMLRAYGRLVLSGSMEDEQAELLLLNHPEADIIAHPMTLESVL